MSRRRPTSWAALAAAALLFSMAARPVSVLASQIDSQGSSSATYQLTNHGSSPVTEVIANVIPPGTVVPSDPSTSPLTIQQGSSGFDQNNLLVLLGNGTDPTGNPVQALKLEFNNGGLQPDGVLNFSLSLGQALGPPTLQLPSSDTGLAITQTGFTKVNDESPGTPTGGTTGGGGNVTTQAIPEPLSLLVWSTGALGLGLAHVRRRRRNCLRL